MKGGQRRSGRVDSGRAGTRDLGQLRRLATYLRPHRPLVIGTLVALTVAALAVLSIGAGLRHIVDGGFVQGRPRASIMPWKRWAW